MRSEGGTVTRIEALIAPTIADMGFLLVRVRYVTSARPRLQIMAERPDGSMNVEDCAELSRAISALLDVEDPISGEYTLEVSSPGLDRPLVKPEDFLRFKSQEARIELMRLMDGRKRFRGRLAGLELGPAGDEVLIEEDGGVQHRVPFSLIDEAKLVLTDELIARSLKAGQPAESGQWEDGAEVELDPEQAGSGVRSNAQAQKAHGRGARKKRERS